jgi:uncharacterized protein DUF3291
VHLAQVNIALPREPLTEPLLADFVAALEPVNALAHAAPGFMWRLVGEEGDDATTVRGFGDDRLIINLSVWESIEALADFVYGGLHLEVMRRRREWFERFAEAYTVCWWVPRGHLPTVAEAEARLAVLRLHGPTPAAFTLQRRFPPDTRDDQLPEVVEEACPV